MLEAFSFVRPSLTDHSIYWRDTVVLEPFDPLVCTKAILDACDDGRTMKKV